MNAVLISCVCCGSKHEDRYESCPDCCEHEYDADEGFMCLGCGRDGTEDVMARAFDMAKARRQDG
jgi:hypothetical protein